MPHLLTLRGRNALSPFRITKLKAAIAAARPGHLIERIGAAYWHFVEVERELNPAEHATLARLLTYGPHDEAADDDGAFMLVVPRPGTISPWSSKATDIARNCGLDVGQAHRARRSVTGSPPRRTARRQRSHGTAAAAARPDDRNGVRRHSTMRALCSRISRPSR